jgi:hypothetical protein
VSSTSSCNLRILPYSLTSPTKPPGPPSRSLCCATKGL